MDKRVKGLDLLRLFAVLFVMLFHYAYRGAMGETPFTALSVPDWHPVVKYGHLGVHLFFVISGFVIAQSTQGRGPLGFVLARFTRIYPAFLICMTVTFAVTMLFGAPEFTASFKQWAANLVIFAPALHQPFMDGAYWSIVYEIIFYGWVTLLIADRRFDRYGTAIALCWIGISVANESLGPSVPLRRLFLTDASGFFLAGITIYRLYAAGRSFSQGVLLALSAELAVGQAIIVSRYNVIHYGADLSKGVVIAIALGAIALVGLCTQLRRDLVPRRAAIWIGGLTYPLYLLHQHVGFIVFNRLGGTVPAKGLVLATMGGMIVAALALYALVERPAQAWLRSALQEPTLARLWPSRRPASPATVPVPTDR